MGDGQHCAGTTKTGNPCKALHLLPGSQYCFAHDPNTRGIPADEKRCTATCTGGTTRPERRGERCEHGRTPGLQVCSFHGGRSPQGKRASAMYLAEKKVRKQMETYGRPIDITATEAIMEEVQRTAGHVKWLGDLVAELSVEDLVWNTTRVKEGGQDAGTTQEAVPHALVKLYKEERAHLVRASAEAIRCGIEERYVRLAERQGEMVAETFKGILADLNLTEQQKVMARNIVPFRLRQLTA